ncbi:hypothetical protein [Clostridium sp. JS66]|uniref:hypothetical protein n=1 Tax=Clostridium sp. JS66 TaxID=3064705 RepID=UPI00298D74B7|nr:hypothetical protein [Clostridium sp. JS66]WPC40939.1 hypothetical protein Q6H37_24070 [Clostridium sp. JS66]
MNIFKLFYTPKKIPKFDVKYFHGNSKNVFGVEIEPDNYTEFISKYYKIFQSNNIQQNIMTNYKFIKFIEQRNNLKLKILNIKLTEKDQLILSQNEIYIDLIKSLNRRNIKEATEFLKELVEDGFNISTVECVLEDKNQHRFNIHDNGTIAFSTSLNDIEKYIKDNFIIDYLCMGILNEE